MDMSDYFKRACLDLNLFIIDLIESQFRRI